MIRLVLADLRHNARMWVWTLVVAAVASGAMAAVFACTATLNASLGADATRRSLGTQVGGQLASYTGIAVVAVVASTAGLTVRSQTRGYALWKILGMPGRRIAAVVRLQLLLTGILGGLLGLPLMFALTPFIADLWVDAGYLADGYSIVYPGWGWWVAPLAIASLTLLGGWFTAGKAGSTAEMVALRESSLGRAHAGWFRLVAGAVFLVGAAAMAGMSADQLSDQGENHITDPLVLGMIRGMGISVLVLFACLILAPWTLRATLHLWTALPVGAVSWRTAVQTARMRAGQSLTTILPFALATSLIGVFLSIGAIGKVIAPTESGTLAEAMVVFVLVFLVCWAGGIANIAMAGRQRHRDAALLGAIGGRPAQVTSATLAEGVIYAGTALIFGVLLTVFTLVTLALTTHYPVRSALAHGPWGPVALVAGLTLITTCAAVAGPALTAGRTNPAEELRQSV